MRHRASPRFWDSYDRLPKKVQRLADHCYRTLREDQRHPSLHFKKIGSYWSVRVGLHHRALGVETEGDLIWFWIGGHAAYDRLICGP